MLSAIGRPNAKLRGMMIGILGHEHLFLFPPHMEKIHLSTFLFTLQLIFV
jgi:hypothetical protein